MKSQNLEVTTVMSPGRSALKRFCLLALLFAGATAGARAEFVVSFFSGVSSAENNDLHYRQAGGTDLTFHDVSYHTKDFGSPIYYGGRVAYFLPEQSHWGFGLEFFHSKIYLDTGDSVRVTGKRGGDPVNDVEPINATITGFNCSHGLNFLFADAMYRFYLGQRDKDFLGRFQPYLGAGVGAAIPHVEFSSETTHFEEYQFHGPAFEGLAGINFDITKYLGLFAEYKFTYVDLDHLSIPGGSIGVAPMQNHLIFGASVRF